MKEEQKSKVQIALEKFSKLPKEEQEKLIKKHERFADRMQSEAAQNANQLQSS